MSLKTLRSICAIPLRTYSGRKWMLALLMLCSGASLIGQTVIRSWTASDGRTIQAGFVRMNGANVVLDRNGVELSIPLTSLDEASIELAKRLAVDGGLVLERGWDTPMQGGSATIKDLGAILSVFAKPAVDTQPQPALRLYNEVTYLMPLADARRSLGLNSQVISKNPVGCPGFPKGSFFHYAYDGVFEGHFNKLYLVTDKADQVIAVQLVAETPKRDQVDAPYKPTDWHTYNFINSRSKAVTRLWVDHKPFYQEKERWREYSPTLTSSQPKEDVVLLRIDSLLMDPIDRRGYRDANWKALESVRLYIPKPIMGLILTCINKGNR